MVHIGCYAYLLSSKSKSVEYTAFQGVALCTIDHHKKFKKASGSTKYKWDNDGKDGRDDRKTSHYYLLEWMEDPFKYASWGRAPGAHTKTHQVIMSVT